MSFKKVGGVHLRKGILGVLSKVLVFGSNLDVCLHVPVSKYVCFFRFC